MLGVDHWHSAGGQFLKEFIYMNTKLTYRARGREHHLDTALVVPPRPADDAAMARAQADTTLDAFAKRREVESIIAQRAVNKTHRELYDYCVFYSAVIPRS